MLHVIHAIRTDMAFVLVLLRGADSFHLWFLREKGMGTFFFFKSERAILMLLRLEGGVDSVFLKNFSKERNIKA